MRTAAWLGLVDRNSRELRALVGRYHPAAKEEVAGVEIPALTLYPLPITAAAPEAACEAIRQEITAKPQEPLVDRFDKALLQRDHATIARLLSDAWFGVPESTSCWNIPGFAILCDLCDDPPDDLEISDEDEAA